MKLPPEQKAIQDKCFHPSGVFVEFPKEDVEATIPARFEKIVSLYPKRIAVKTPTQQLTYEELNRAVNGVAHAILAQRSPDREPVGLLFPKGASLVVAILGALKAGKVYVLLDPAFPPARLCHILDNSQASLLVTNRRFGAIVKTSGQQRSCLHIDELDPDISTEDPRIPLSPDDVAYILYTSGSTGLPKGVVETHRNALHNVRVETNAFRICPEDKLAFIASNGRDILRAALNGASLYPAEIRKEGLASLARWLIEEEITLYSSVVSAFREFAKHLEDGEHFPHVRVVKLVGETVYRSDVELYQKRFSGPCILVNSYGPNETGRVSQYVIDQDTKITSSTLPVGYALDDKEVVLLNENGDQVGFEQTGEIAVRSRYLSPGYWRQPDLTRAAFSLASADPMDRVYRTGDLGWMQPDGCLMHLGRKDFQVKIRGNRVEIAEVEMALQQIEGVKQAIVAAREDTPGDKRLIAYIVPTAAPVLNANCLRSALATKLPDYMIPSSYVFLEALPLAGIGKVDRRALPNPGTARPNLDTPYLSPRTPVEQRLVETWAEVLSLDRVGVQDNFFALGGDSLLATRVVSQIVKHFHFDIPLHSFFQMPTVGGIAGAIAEYQGNKLGDQELKNIIAELEALPEEEAEGMLAKKKTSGENGSVR